MLVLGCGRPGDYLQAEDDEIEGFKLRLNERLAPVGNQFSGAGVNDEWVIGDTLAQWWRPNFETFMYPFLPAHVTRPKECKKLYFIQLPKSSTSLSKVPSRPRTVLPPTSSCNIPSLAGLPRSPKDDKKKNRKRQRRIMSRPSVLANYISTIEVLSVPKNMKLLAVPLFELYDNTARYGPQLSAIPHLLSRYNFEFVDEEGNVSAQTPGSEPPSRGIRVLAGGAEQQQQQEEQQQGNGFEEGGQKEEEEEGEGAGQQQEEDKLKMENGT